MAEIIDFYKLKNQLYRIDKNKKDDTLEKLNKSLSDLLNEKARIDLDIKLCKDFIEAVKNGEDFNPPLGTA